MRCNRHNPVDDRVRRYPALLAGRIIGIMPFSGIHQQNYTARLSNRKVSPR